MKNRCKEGERISDMPLLEKIIVRGVIMSISDTTINRFLHGPNFNIQDTSPTFNNHLKDWENQRRWLVTHIVDREPIWLTNPNERIYKASLIPEEKFWWGIVRMHLIPTENDNQLEDDRAVLVASLVNGISLDIGEIIAEEINIWVSRTGTLIHSRV